MNTSNLSAPVDVAIYFDDKFIGRTVTCLERADISKLVEFPVKAGFQFSLLDIAAENLEGFFRSVKACEDRNESIEKLITARFELTNDLLGISDIFKITDRQWQYVTDFLSEKQRDVYGNFAISSRRETLDTFQPMPQDYSEEDVRCIAFYLPQYHPIPENNEWWGAGFTEWTNVSSAKQYFDEHYQPRFPADFGYYDLRVDEVHARQVRMAKNYGISAFCYYYYWFAGKTLLDLPIKRHFEQDLDLDFCICWANENWSRRWDGSESSLLMKQQHSVGDDVRFIEDVLPYFSSERYIKIDGAPLILIYRVSLIINPPQVIARWKQIAREAGYPDLHVSICETFGIEHPYQYGADSACQFPPHNVAETPITETVTDLNAKFAGDIFDYSEIVINEMRRPVPNYLRYPAAMTAWDNTSRKGLEGRVYHNSTPAMFETWLSFLAARVRHDFPPGQRFVFINAWNEWAEGAYLEPDRRFGHDYLRAVRNALSAQNTLVGDLLLPDFNIDSEVRQRIVNVISTLQNANRRILESICRVDASVRFASSFIAQNLGDVAIVQQDGAARCWLDNVNGLLGRQMCLTISVHEKLSTSGWVNIPKTKLSYSWPMFMCLLPEGGSYDFCYIASVNYRSNRADVLASFNRDRDRDHFNGFSFSGDLSWVKPGRYNLKLLVANERNDSSLLEIATPLALYIG